MKRGKLALLVLLASAALAVSAAPAAALTTVSQSGGVGGTLTITGDGASEFLVVEYGAGMLGTCPPEYGQCDTVLADVIGQDTVHFQAGSGCMRGSNLYEEWGIVCPDSNYVVADLGAGNDGIKFYSNSVNPSFDYAYETATVHGGPGNDTLEGVEAASIYPDRDLFYGDAGYDELSGYVGNDVLHGGDDADSYLFGGPGNDEIYGDGGDDLYLNGQEGDDLIDGGPGDDVFGASRGYGTPGGDPGSDRIVGGPGYETMTYATAGSAVSVTMDDQANDGIPGENDNISGDIDRIEGSGYADTLIGSAGPNELDGGGGNDYIDGGGGNDTLKGGANNDTVIGGPGQDTINGDAGFCSLGWGDCPGGSDTIKARDGERDALDCGPEADTADADTIDIVPTTGWETCETVWLDGVAQAGGGGGGTQGGETQGGGPNTGGGGGQVVADMTAPALALAGSKAQKLGATVSVTIVAGSEDRWVSASGRVQIAGSARRLALGAVKPRLAAKGKRVVLKLAVPASVKRKIAVALRRHKRVTATVTVRARDAAGNGRTRTRSIRLKR